VHVSLLQLLLLMVSCMSCPCVLCIACRAHRCTSRAATQAVGRSSIMQSAAAATLTLNALAAACCAHRRRQGVDWCAAFPSLPLSPALRAFGQLLDALAGARAAHEEATASTCLPDDVPDDFLDPITMELLRDPVKLPDPQIVVDR